MFEFEVIQELKSNDKILEIIKDYNYTVTNDKRILWEKQLGTFAYGKQKEKYKMFYI